MLSPQHGTGNMLLKCSWRMPMKIHYVKLLVQLDKEIVYMLVISAICKSPVYAQIVQ